jgi:hypothetical protein
MVGVRWTRSGCFLGERFTVRRLAEERTLRHDRSPGVWEYTRSLLLERLDSECRRQIDTLTASERCDEPGCVRSRLNAGPVIQGTSRVRSWGLRVSRWSGSVARTDVRVYGDSKGLGKRLEYRKQYRSSSRSSTV